MSKKENVFAKSAAAAKREQQEIVTGIVTGGKRRGRPKTKMGEIISTSVRFESEEYDRIDNILTLYNAACLRSERLSKNEFFVTAIKEKADKLEKSLPK